jgi:putative ABC transport system permease protein
MNDLWRDLRYGAQMLRKNYGFTAIAVLTLALGIGANTAIFSVVNGVLLNPLPYPESGQLMVAHGIHVASSEYAGVSMPDYREWEKRNQSFSGMAAYAIDNYNISGNAEPERVGGAGVTTEFFALLGINPAQGRGFLSEEGVYGKHRVAVLSDALWRRRFGDGTRLSEQTIQVNGEVFTIIGVMPRGFRFPDDNVAFWMPIALRDADPLNTRGNYWLSVIARLKKGVTREQGQNDLINLNLQIYRQLEQENPKVDIFSARVEALTEATVGDSRRMLLVLLSAVGCVLLIACVNVANLLLARASVRAPEIALRATLGANRWRLVRQLLTESLLMGVLGAACGLLLAKWGVDVLIRLEPDLPRLDTVRVDGRVLAFTVVLAMVTSLLFGLLPALRSAHTDLSVILKGGGRSGTRNHRMLSGLVVVEIAVALILLAGAGLMINSLFRLQRVDAGFETGNILTMQLAPHETRYSEPEQALGFYRQLIERVKALPGVQNVSVTSVLPLTDGGYAKFFNRVDRPSSNSPQEVNIVQYRKVSAGYFETLGIRLVEGRYLSERDTANGLPVAIVNETAAKRFWPEGSPLGKVFKLGRLEDDRITRWTVVGVMKDIKHYGLSLPSEPDIYTPMEQGMVDGAPRAMYLAVRTANDPTPLTAAIRRQVSELDKEQAIADIATMEDRRAGSLQRTQFNALLLSIFAAVALFLAMIGIYGVMSYSVAERTREIGIRVALGARRGDLLGLIVKRGMRLVLLGSLVGLGGAIGVTRLMSSMLYGVGATDPLTFAAVAGLLVGVALLACYLPARRATKVDPMVTLRSDR